MTRRSVDRNHPLRRHNGFCFSMRAGNCSLRPRARSAVQYRAHRGVRCAHVCPGTPPPRDPFEGAFLVSCFAETSEPGLRRVESDRETTSLGLHYCSEGSVRALDDGEDAFARGCRGLTGALRSDVAPSNLLYPLRRETVYQSASAIESFSQSHERLVRRVAAVVRSSGAVRFCPRGLPKGEAKEATREIQGATTSSSCE